MVTLLRTFGRSAVAASVLLPALVLGSAAPAPADEKDGGRAEPKPPASMSTVGGKRLGLPGTQVEPRPGAPKVPGDVTARSWIVADAETGDVLAAHNAHWELPPASTLKMLFADTLLPKFDGEATYTVLPKDLEPMGPGSSAVGVKENHDYSVHELWNGVFLASGNDAVHALAAMNGGLDKTVREMNERAEELGAADTHVVSPDGYDAQGQTSSAYDLTLIARSGMQKPDFRAYAATARAKFPGGYADGDGGEGDGGSGEDAEREREFYEIQSTNRLLVGSHGLEPYEGLAGIKNGSTTEAGNTFTGIAERDDRALLVTVMHPDEKKRANGVYEEAAALLDWGFAAAEHVEPVGELVPPEGAVQPVGQARDTATAGQAGGPTAEDVAVGGVPSAEGGDSGLRTAVGLAAGTALLLGAATWLAHRRWPSRR
ncbi:MULTISPECIES: D-alanyl-D-alanine carboxypeptidase family protein [Streptomyces]|uniref:D-alanyl-D-alanine carboxypeptidase family protein n=1 Tax=Streptomyces TaxID=1883 RepID=UPI0022493D31|nr:D-alanyl-D-alanine carboxypeptidase [Streptomyces sp. JHD 1]MCX2971487.1 D-alanyl-D-alanine carboxypeptidase [Streptomyces sp. JHD 1]